MEDVTIRFADSKDKEAIKNLLSVSGLPYEDIADHIPHFIVAKKDNTLVGAVGIELLGDVGLLRSLTVSPTYRNNGIGRFLCERMIAYASLQGVRQLYLLTVSAEGFFKKYGFQKIEREGAPLPIQGTKEFKTLCPVAAVCMTKMITGEAQHYPKEALSLREDVSGTRMWAVSLDKTMMTYFEVEPYSRFENHSHESEQITLVLKGELFFETGRKVIAVKEGEVIAIPSNVPHAAFTKEKRVTAVDAWSPVMEKYKK